MPSQARFWLGSPITKCQICDSEILDKRGSVFADAKSIYGPWAIVCMLCLLSDCVGLGTGTGQKYRHTGATEPHKKWKKIAG